ncbi:MAG TPA: zinc-ribbon domain-containing protein [Cyclobacteriaceae bacterium]|nr:zinc-ribbon domain-containing protein [Cyclobacteriaceae bacterium]
MIIYGSNSRHLKTIQLPHEKCPNCGTAGSMIVSVYNRYAHVFWIPFFPIGRKGASQCTNCQQVLEPKAMPTFLKLQYDQALAQTRIPIWSFSGLAILLALIVWVSYSTGANKENERKFLSTPLRGDLYRFKTDAGYSLMKVSDVMPDSIFIMFNNYEVDKMSGVYKLKDKDYDSAGVWIKRETILNMYDSSTIYGVDR